jgi:hypothetical protein
MLVRDYRYTNEIDKRFGAKNITFSCAKLPNLEVQTKRKE